MSEGIETRTTAAEQKMLTVRAAVYRQLFPSAWPSTGLSPANRFITIAVLLSIGIAILETEQTIYIAVLDWFALIEITFAIVFGVEYILRLWAAGEDPRYMGPLGRFKYLATPAAIVDLIAIAPFFLSSAAPNLFAVRLIRLVQILRVARLGRFSTALRCVGSAIATRRYELGVSLALAAIALIFSATGIYVLEGEEQPEQFGSIPRALWWSIATLTTVGYGDVYPHSVVGKMFAGLTAIAGIGLIAMPTGILAAAFSDAFQRGRNEPKNPKRGEN